MIYIYIWHRDAPYIFYHVGLHLFHPWTLTTSNVPIPPYPITPLRSTHFYPPSTQHYRCLPIQSPFPAPPPSPPPPPQAARHPWEHFGTLTPPIGNWPAPPLLILGGWRRARPRTKRTHFQRWTAADRHTVGLFTLGAARRDHTLRVISVFVSAFYIRRAALSLCIRVRY